MTLTAPGCPVAGEMLRRVEKAALLAPGDEGRQGQSGVRPALGSGQKMSDEAKLELGML